MEKDELKLNLLFYLKKEFDDENGELIQNLTSSISKFIDSDGKDVQSRL